MLGIQRKPTKPTAISQRLFTAGARYGPRLTFRGIDLRVLSSPRDTQPGREFLALVLSSSRSHTLSSANLFTSIFSRERRYTVETPPSAKRHCALQRRQLDAVYRGKARKCSETKRNGRKRARERERESVADVGRERAGARRKRKRRRARGGALLFIRSR